MLNRIYEVELNEFPDFCFNLLNVICYVSLKKKRFQLNPIKDKL